MSSFFRGNAVKNICSLCFSCHVTNKPISVKWTFKQLHSYRFTNFFCFQVCSLCRSEGCFTLFHGHKPQSLQVTHLRTEKSDYEINLANDKPALVSDQWSDQRPLYFSGGSWPSGIWLSSLFSGLLKQQSSVCTDCVCSVKGGRIEVKRL